MNWPAQDATSCWRLVGLGRLRRISRVYDVCQVNRIWHPGETDLDWELNLVLAAPQ